VIQHTPRCGSPRRVQYCTSVTKDIDATVPSMSSIMAPGSFTPAAADPLLMRCFLTGRSACPSAYTDNEPAVSSACSAPALSDGRLQTLWCDATKGQHHHEMSRHFRACLTMGNYCKYVQSGHVCKLPGMKLWKVLST